MTVEIYFGKPCGRQPETIYVAPSKSYPWYGGSVDGQGLTAQQHYMLNARKLDASTLEIVTVYRQATSREMWWPTGYGMLPPLFSFQCPMLSKRKDGFARVITPSGEVKHVIPLYGRFWAAAPHGLKAANRHIHPRDWKELECSTSSQ